MLFLVFVYQYLTVWLTQFDSAYSKLLTFTVDAVAN